VKIAGRPQIRKIIIFEVTNARQLAGFAMNGNWTVISDPTLMSQISRIRKVGFEVESQFAIHESSTRRKMSCRKLPGNDEGTARRRSTRREL